MSDGTPYRDQRLPYGDHYIDEGPYSPSAKMMFVGLAALLLVAGLGAVFYFAARPLWDGLIRSERASFREPREPPAVLPATLPRAGSPPYPDLVVPPPVARMLEAEAKRAGSFAERPAEKQGLEKRSMVLASSQRQLPAAREFRPSPRVVVARRLLLQPQRVRYASRVVQFGTYPNRRLARKAYSRLVKVYPYLKTLPRTITPSQLPTSGTRAFHLRLSAGSPDQARVICQNLLAIGRGCAVLPESA